VRGEKKQGFEDRGNCGIWLGVLRFGSGCSMAVRDSIWGPFHVWRCWLNAVICCIVIMNVINSFFMPLELVVHSKTNLGFYYII